MSRLGDDTDEVEDVEALLLDVVDSSLIFSGCVGEQLERHRWRAA
jgi:hypothetical protein